MTVLDFKALGPLEVERAGEPVALGGDKPRTMLAALLAGRGRTVSMDKLIDTLWGEAVPATANKTIQKYASRLRKQIGDVLVTRDKGYAIEIEPGLTDVGQFEIELEKSEIGDKEQHLTAALALWRGNPFPELAGDISWQPLITQLTERRLQATEQLINVRLDAGAAEDVIPELEELIATNPTRERFWAQLMLALYRASRQSDALNVFTRLRRYLGTELGIEPSPELRDLEERILLQDPSLIPAQDAGPQTNLVAPLTSFVGREREMDEVISLLDESRLVTLMGAAGSGKTRLATETARNLLDRYEGSIWFIDLAVVRSPDQIHDAIARPLGLGAVSEKPIAEVLLEYLRDRRMLLILDNCEHMTSAVASVVEELLSNSEDLVILATSRERLGVGGEVLFSVPPLTYPEGETSESASFEAVRLFTERAHAANPHLGLGDAKTIADIVRRLDGIPLAIELAAARTHNVGLKDMRDLLDDRFALLTAPTRDDLGRHQTLQTAVDWSYRLLDDEERRLFNRLSVFRGGFDIRAVGDVTTFDPAGARNTLGLLNDLVDRSLVNVNHDRHGHARFSMLETLRDYGRTRLETDEAARLRGSHTDYYCQLAEEASEKMSGPDHREALDLFAGEHDNIRKALQWGSTTDPETLARIAIAMSGYWDSVGPRSEGHEWLQRSMAVSGELDPSIQIDLHLAASDIFSSAHAALPIEYAERALKIARSTGDELGIARSLRALCWAHTLEEQPQLALELGTEALRLFRKLGARWDEALCLERLGQAGYQDPDWAVDRLNVALRLFREVGDRTREALVLYKLADTMAQSLGKSETALRYAEQAVAICDEIGDVHDGAHARLEYGKVLRRAGSPEQAIKMLEVAFERLSRSGDERCSVRSMTALGVSQLDAGDIEAGRETLRESLIRGGRLEETHTSRTALAGLARVSGDPKKEATIYGLVQRLGQEASVPTSASSQARRTETRERLRSVLGTVAFEEAWARGHEMSLDEAVEYALQASD